jgi:hypothetical protein
LHHFQEGALLPVPQKVNFLVERAEKPVPKQVIEKGAISQLPRSFIPAKVQLSGVFVELKIGSAIEGHGSADARDIALHRSYAMHRKLS